MQVLDDVRLLGPVEKRRWRGVVLLGPQAGGSWVDSYRSNMGEEVHNESPSSQLHAKKTQGKRRWEEKTAK